jgi:hypothetical protein
MHVGLLLQYCYTVRISARPTSHKIPVATRSKAWVCGSSLAGIAGSNPGGGMDVLSFVSVMCCLCDGQITRPEESYLVLCV